MRAREETREEEEATTRPYRVAIISVNSMKRHKKEDTACSLQTIR
jgi:hypothetical protein